MPSNWPCQWNDGVIPFVFDFFALSPRRLMSLVKKAHSYIQDRSCLVFKEVNPIDGALEADFTYLFYTYSEVLENCCLKFFSKSENEHYGRRFILITPTCFLQVEVAHATLHGLGLDHAKTGFSEGQARSVLFPYKCKDMDKKLELLERNFKILT